MAKISELASGGIILETDELVALRAGGNVRVKVDGLATQDASSVSITGGSITGLSALTADGIVVGDGHTIGDDTFDNLVIQSSSGEGIRLVDNHATNVLSIESDVGFVSKTLLGTSRFSVDNSTGNVSIPSGNLSVTGSVTSTSLETGSATFEGAAVNIDILETNTTDVNTRFRLNAGDFIVQTLNDAQDTVKSRLAIDNATGDVSFYEDTGTTPKFFWDASAESLGIGTAVPDAPMHISKAATGINAATTLLKLSSVDTNTAQYVGFQTQRDNSAGQGLNILVTDVAGTVSEAMRIGTTGSLLIGRTTENSTDSGHRFSSSGFAAHIVANDYPLLLNRLSSDGALLTMRKDSVTVGTMGIESGGFYIDGEASHTGLTFGGNSVVPRDNGARVDNSVDLGSSVHRFKDLYLAGSASIGKTGSPGVLLLNRSSDGGAAGALSLSGDDFVMNTGYSSGDLVFKNGATEAMRIDSSGKVGLNVSSITDQLEINGGASYPHIRLRSSVNTSRYMRMGMTDATTSTIEANGTSTVINFKTAGSEGMRIDSSQNLLIGKTGLDATTAGFIFNQSTSSSGANAYAFLSNTRTDGSNYLLGMNRQGSDGRLIEFRQANNVEGYIQVSGSTVSLVGFSGHHESSGIPITTEIGTVVSTIDELDVYHEGSTKAGKVRVDHAKVEVSETEDDPCVYGVVSSFTDEGKVIIGSVGVSSVKVTGACKKGDLLSSNGDGTAKVQADDIVRSRTVGKVTVGNSDPSVKLVSCVLYCG